jgi:GTP-binding protein YchF
MRLGIIGLPNSGKTTIFNALTGSNIETAAVSSGQFEIHTAVVNVPDERIDRLSAMYEPKKTIFATITFVDIGGLDKGISQGGLKGQFRNELQQVDGFVHVVRGFVDETVPHPYETVDPARDLAIIDGEFLLSDLVAIENRLQKLQDELRIKGKKAESVVLPEIEMMERLKAALEDETPLRNLDLTADDKKMLRGYGFMSLKPVIVLLNCGEELAEPLNYPHQNTFSVSMQGQLEAEIRALDDAESAQMFMEEYNISELMSSRVIRMSYELMAIHAFFTVGKDEVRAWSVARGATAPEAAGTIHSDLQKGFIRAEVMRYEDLIEVGSEAALKQAGKFRLEGRDYVVHDGDILNIRFQTNVK